MLSREVLVSKHFTPRQIREWFAPEAAGKGDTLLARLAAELTLKERSDLEAALAEAFAPGGREWRQGYDFLVAGYPLA